MRQMPIIFDQLLLHDNNPRYVFNSSFNTELIQFVAPVELSSARKIHAA
jgi:hypothetical protein